ncbi:ribosome maturation factor RimM [Candidatus Sororendozoicomonas aggregata]|uniref:ribosome maturation factor RimM n=1 Tax=Candidatus Sororendozoicomonas aggregata TaxID=3073239 RepID=UPI002ED2A086
MTFGEKTSETSAVKRITLGSVVAVYGVKGWVKVYSHTSPMDNILNYRHWIVSHKGRIETVEIDQGRLHGKGLVVHIAGCDDRESARNYCDSEIMVNASDMPPAPDDEVYWHQLEGLSVFSRDGVNDNVLLGKVSHLMATGANDVLVIAPSKGSVDKRERLVPWLVNQVVLDVNPEKGFIRVDWDPEY